MERVNKFFCNLQQDVKVFIFYMVLFSIFRAAFIAIYGYQLNDAEFNEIILSMWYGARLSLKTAGMLVLIGAFFLLCYRLFIYVGRLINAEEFFTAVRYFFLRFVFLPEYLIIKFLIQLLI